MARQRCTNEYRLLVKRVKELEESLIKEFISKDTLNMSKKEIELARAYRLLDHADLKE